MKFQLVFLEYLLYGLEHATLSVVFGRAVQCRLRPHGESRVDVHDVLLDGECDAVRLFHLVLGGNFRCLPRFGVELRLLHLDKHLNLFVKLRVHDVVLLRLPVRKVLACVRECSAPAFLKIAYLLTDVLQCEDFL